ncbi:hypothetical protein ACFLS8_02290 [Chloroflexota bacterium]
MPKEENAQDRTAADNFGKLIKAFGDAVGEIFDDPKLKEKAKEFADSAVVSAKAFGSRFKDEEVKDKFGDVGKAAQDFGKSVADCFKASKDK